ncbi:hypothetical protein X805_33520 [Sphaerotilus natans subsp. natans DSM 6575]|uniref:Uncharacterized protein n=1 Tax=Sphaerotilus natans subsp. natans DSM 6575 TaxID=1286631 RepID=A0A059KI03_9BURK|nr:hypothetical protein X805_33520 [Sphaerotilus natans subsp. natans DSM 6575]
MSTDREIGVRQLQAHLFTQVVHERCSWFVEGARAHPSRIDVRPPVSPSMLAIRRWLVPAGTDALESGTRSRWCLLFLVLS